MITTHHEITPEFLASQNLSPTFQERFWAKVQKTDGCWGWKGYLNPFGYGAIKKRSYVSVRAHVASWILHFGPIPDGMCVCHTCDNPPCVNPNHLWLGTRSDNHMDMCIKGRNNKGHGVIGSKLSSDNVEEIREIIKTAKHGDLSVIARRFGVNQSTISKIKSGRNWAHLHGDD